MRHQRIFRLPCRFDRRSCLCRSIFRRCRFEHLYTTCRDRQLVYRHIRHFHKPDRPCRSYCRIFQCICLHNKSDWLNTFYPRMFLWGEDHKCHLCKDQVHIVRICRLCKSHFPGIRCWICTQFLALCQPQEEWRDRHTQSSRRPRLQVQCRRVPIVWGVLSW